MSLFSFVRNQLSILDVAQSYIALKPAGKYWKGLSPFTNEKTPSFTVSPDKNIYYCFSSQYGGDVIDLVSRLEKCSQIEAVKILIERYNLQVPAEVLQGHTTHNSGENTYFKAHEVFMKWAQQNLQNSTQAKSYFSSRGVSQEMVEVFNLGFCAHSPSAASTLTSMIREANLTLEDMHNAGLLKKINGVWRSIFHERVLFPISDHLGRWCGFGGRILQETPGKPKYVNSLEHTYFNKGTLLYGLHQAKKSIKESGTVFLVEGYTDCIAMYQAGYRNTVATLGTACSLEHLKQLSRYATTAYLLYDGDDAGKKALLRIAELSWQVRIELRVLTLPQGYDPADFLASGNTLEDMIYKAPTIFGAFIDYAHQASCGKTLPERLQSIESVVALLHKIHDPLQKNLLLQQVSATFDVPLDTLAAALQKLPQTHANQEKPNVPDQKREESALSKLSSLEQQVVYLLLGSSTILPDAIHNTIQNSFSSSACNYIDQHQTYWKNNTGVVADFLETLTLQDQHRILSYAHTGFSDETALFEHIKRLTYLHAQQQWKSKVQELKVKIAAAQRAQNAPLVSELLRSLQTMYQSVAKEDNDKKEKNN